MQDVTRVEYAKPIISIDAYRWSGLGFRVRVNLAMKCT